MGTRHMIGIISGGQYKVAQYGQWDGYVKGGQGESILKFLCTHDISVLKNKLDNCRFIDKDELRQMYVNAGDKPNNTSGFIEFSVELKMNEMYPSLSRDTGAKILDIIYDSTGEVPLIDNKSFLDDGLFCEYAYVINFDENALICYKNGRNEVARYNLNELPTIDKMEKDIDGSGDE